MAVFLFMVMLLAVGSKATTDLNEGELRYVADHLTNKECRKLHEALNMRHFDLDHKVKGKNEAHVPCIVLLEYWDKVENKKGTFQILSLRLKQIGRGDLADWLSRTVMKEKSDEVKRTFLGNSMKGLIAHNSPLLKESPKDHLRFQQEEETMKKPVGWTSMHTIAVVCSGLSLILISVIVIVKCGYDEKWKSEFNKRLEARKRKAKGGESEELLVEGDDVDV